MHYLTGSGPETLREQFSIIGVVEHGCKGMIISRLAGGLGNQMFQYAAGRALADCLGTSLSLDLSSLRSRSKPITARDYGLDGFHTNAELFDPAKLLLRNLAHKFPSLVARMNGRHVLKESGVDYMPSFFGSSDETVLIGYWQSHKYFSNIAEKLFLDFQPRTSFCSENLAFAKLLVDNEHSVALHVRRGDYVGLPSASLFHGALSDAYYKDAIKLACKNDGDLNIFVFSDDIEWCRTHFRGIVNVEFAPSPVNAQPWEDMTLMGLCRGNIIANSSYSWWSAWLGDMRYRGRNRLVIAPKRWFARQIFCAADRFPVHWTLI
jgi:hypothetical protein